MPIGFPASPTIGQQYPVVDPLWEWNGTVWESLSGTPVTLRYTSLVSTDDALFLRAGVPGLVSAAVMSAEFGGGVSPTAPAAFTSGQWTLTPIAGGLRYGINALPSNGGSAITALQYTLDGTTWAPFSGTGTGDRDVLGLPETLQTTQIRAVNAIGNGAASDTKTGTPLAGAGETFIRFSTLVNMTETGGAGTGWIYSGTVVEGYAGGSDYTLASGVAGGATVNTGLGGNTPSPLLGFYTTAAGVWNDSFHVIAYPFFFGGGPEWQFNGPGFSDLVTTVRTYVDGDRVRIRFDSSNGVVGEIARAAAPDTWLQIGAGTVTRGVTLYPRLHAHDGGGSGATAVFTAPFVSP